jgi:O-antigen ligase
VSTSQLAAGLVAIGVAAGLTLSPGLGGLALALGVWAWTSPRRVPSGAARRAALACGMLGAAGLAFLTCVSLSFSHGLHASARVRLWRQVASGFAHHPWLGAGLARRLALVIDVKPSGAIDRLTDAHEVWLSVAGQMGVLGVIALGAVVLVAVGGTRPRLPTTPIPKALMLAFVGAFFYQGLSMSIEETRHIWLLVGLLAAVTQTVAARAPLASRR